eukprot:4645635-Amphidinium_carterae.1
MIQAVPGYLSGDALLNWISFYVVGLTTAILSSVLMPMLADWLSSARGVQGPKHCDAPGPLEGLEPKPPPKKI